MYVSEFVDFSLCCWDFLTMKFWNVPYCSFDHILIHVHYAKYGQDSESSTFLFQSLIVIICLLYLWSLNTANSGDHGFFYRISVELIHPCRIECMQRYLYNYFNKRICFSQTIPITIIKFQEIISEWSIKNSWMIFWKGHISANIDLRSIIDTWNESYDNL